MPPPTKRFSGATVIGVWGVIGTFGAAAGAGFAAATVINDRVRASEFAEFKREQDAANRAFEKTLTSQGKDIEWIKGALRVAQEPAPLSSEKKK